MSKGNNFEIVGHSVVDREFIYKYIKNTAKSPKYPQTSIFAIYGRIARSNAWKMFLCIFQDFDFLKVEYFLNPPNTSPDTPNTSRDTPNTSPDTHNTSPDAQNTSPDT